MTRQYCWRATGPAPGCRTLRNGSSPKGLARSRWDAHVLRAAFREPAPGVRGGRLVDVVAPAADVVDQEPGAGDAVLQLRVLVDALTTWP